MGDDLDDGQAEGGMLERVLCSQSVAGVSEREALDEVADDVGDVELVEVEVALGVQFEGLPVVVGLERVAGGQTGNLTVRSERRRPKTGPRGGCRPLP